MDDETPDMPSVWITVDRELHRRRVSWAKLARELHVSDQTVWNWKKRDTVPMKHLPGIASFLGEGWTVEKLLGLIPEPPRQPVVRAPAPEPLYTKRANDIARAFDELKDHTVRQNAYSLVMAQIQMAKAGQRLPEAQAPAIEPEPDTTPTLKTHPPAPAPKKRPARGR